MVKKGEYYEFALDLEKKSVDYDPNIILEPDELFLGTNLSMTVEIAKKLSGVKKKGDFTFTNVKKNIKIEKDLIQIKYNYEKRLKFLERFFNVFIDQLDAETRYAGFREKLIQEYSEFL